MATLWQHCQGLASARFANLLYRNYRHYPTESKLNMAKLMPSRQKSRLNPGSLAPGEMTRQKNLWTIG